jgi:hypothetical protein
MRLAPTVVLLASVLVQACANRLTNSDAANSRSTNGAKTAVAPRCDPNYSDCVPIATDVDCAGGKGNGPVYVKGPVKVIGEDIYGLDKDGDGIGCE